MSSEAVKEQVLERVLPDQEERDALQDMFQQIKEFIEEEYGLEALLMGSTAKDTFIAGDKDLDIFVFFPEDFDEEELEELGLGIGETVFQKFDGDFVVEYAEHPYTKGHINGYEVEVVPAYDVESGEKIQSAVDRTPFHTEWVNETLNMEEKHEVVALKAFLRGQDLYGSTLKVEGFSGYLCELLIAEYGSFEAVMEAALGWDEQQVIDPADHHGDTPFPGYLKQKFDEEDLVMIDPVDKERNVASVLSNENYAKFIYSVWQYRQSPDTSFFFPDKKPVQKLDIERELFDRGDFIQLACEQPDVVDDILYPQLRSLMRRLTQVLEDNEFRIFESGFTVINDEIRILFELYSQELPGKRKQHGPRVFHNRDHLQNFTEKYGDVWVEDDRLVTVIDRDHTDAENLLEEFFRGDLREKGVPKDLVEPMEEVDIGDLTLEHNEWRQFLGEEFRLDRE